MSDEIYNRRHVEISRLLGREYNNPLGASAFPLLRRLQAISDWRAVLDAGCGRGQTAVWWALHEGLTVDAFDPSQAMLEEGRLRAQAAGVGEHVKFHLADFASYHSATRYGLILAHDTLCYSREWEKDAARLACLLSEGELLSVTDYYMEADAPEVRGVLDAWGIADPQSFAHHQATFQTLGLRALFHFDTTRQYREHWTSLRGVLSAKRAEAESLIGREAVEAFAARIEAILNAVASGKFGHCWTILEAAA